MNSDSHHYARAPAADRIREARERLGLPTEVVAKAAGIGVKEYQDLEDSDVDVFMSLSLEELGRLAARLELHPVEIVATGNGTAQGEPVSMEELMSAICKVLDETGETVEAFEERVGWEVREALQDPQRAWRDWNADCLQDVCRAVGIEWLRALASWTAPSR